MGSSHPLAAVLVYAICHHAMLRAVYICGVGAAALERLRFGTGLPVRVNQGQWVKLPSSTPNLPSGLSPLI